jgi:hypothetical protein
VPKTLNLTNLTQPPETEGNPWSALLWGSGDFALGAYTAHEAITSLSRSWAEDTGDNRRFVLTSLEETIKALSQFYWGLKVTLDYETFSEDNRALAERMSKGTVTRADLDAFAKRVDALHDLRGQCGLTDVAPALIEAAFDPSPVEWFPAPTNPT